MIQNVWLNLPVVDLELTRTFFSAIGFRFNEKRSGNNFICMEAGTRPVIVNFWPEEDFAGFFETDIVADVSFAAEVLISFDAESREEVDELAAKVKAAGGEIISAPMTIQGWKYGFAFKDPDNHRWNVLYMDTSKMPARK